MILVSPIRWAALVALLPLVGCQPPDERLPGYVEGDYVRVASPQGGRLQQLSVTEGEQLAAGAPLFRLEAEPERSNLAAARFRVLLASRTARRTFNRTGALCLFGAGAYVATLRHGS